MKRHNRTQVMIATVAGTLLLPALTNGATASVADMGVYMRLSEWCNEAAVQRARVIAAADKLSNTKRAFIVRMSDVNTGTKTLANRLSTLAPTDATNQTLIKEMSTYLNGRSSLVDNVIKKSKAGKVQEGLLLLRKVGPEHAEIELSLQRRVYAKSGKTCSALVDLPAKEFSTATSSATPSTAPQPQPTTSAPPPTSSVGTQTPTTPSPNSIPPRSGLSFKPTVSVTTTTAPTSTAGAVAGGPTVTAAPAATAPTATAPPATTAPTATAPTVPPSTSAPTTTQPFVVGTATTIPVGVGGAARFLPISQPFPLLEFTAAEESQYRQMIGQLRAGTGVTDVVYRRIDGVGVMFVVEHEFFAISQADEITFNNGVIHTLKSSGLSLNRAKPIASFTDVASGDIRGHSSLNSLVAFRPGLYVLFISSVDHDVTALAQSFLPQFRS